MTPFNYPQHPHERRHAPRGYLEYERFRPWLRDEFFFRCVFCLAREQWVVRFGGFAIEHFVPASQSPSEVARYENLLYACTACNLAKAAHLIPDPLATLIADTVVVHANGRIEGRTADARRIIRKLGLDDAQYARFRRQWMIIVQLAKNHDPEFFRELMSYPNDLPDLARLRPPGRNARPEGVAQSHYERRERGELAVTY